MPRGHASLLPTQRVRKDASWAREGIGKGRSPIPSETWERCSPRQRVGHRGEAPGKAASGARCFLGKQERRRGGAERSSPPPACRREAGKVAPGSARACRRLSKVLKGPRGRQTVSFPRALRRPGARSALPASCPVLFPFPPLLLPRALHSRAAATPRAPGPPCRAWVCGASSPGSHLQGASAAGLLPPPPSYLLLAITGAVPPLPVGFLLLLLLLEGLRLDVFDFLQLFGRLSHGGSRCFGPRLPDPLTLGNPGGDTLPRRKKEESLLRGAGSFCPRRGKDAAGSAGEAAASPAEGEARRGCPAAPGWRLPPRPWLARRRPGPALGSAPPPPSLSPSLPLLRRQRRGGRGRGGRSYCGGRRGAAREADSSS